MELTGPKCKYFYLCDRKPGACKSWKKYGWTFCHNPMCEHTTNPDHSRNKIGRMFRLIVNEDGTAERWEIEKKPTFEVNHE